MSKVSILHISDLHKDDDDENLLSSLVTDIDYCKDNKALVSTKKREVGLRLE